MTRASYIDFFSANAKREKRGKCPTHPDEEMKDEATTAGVSPSSLCAACEPLIIVDHVRDLYVRRRDHERGW